MSKILGLLNTSTQTLATNDAVNLGSVYRANSSGCAYALTGANSVSIKETGFYKVSGTITFTAPTAGVVTFQLAVNNVAVVGATTSASVTTAATEVNTLPFEFFIAVSKGCVGGIFTTLQNSISIINVGIGSTVTNVVTNIEKVG